MRRSRRNHSPAFKANVALAALQSDDNLTQLAQRFDVHANQIAEWRKQLIARAEAAFAAEADRPGVEPVDVKTLHAKIGKQALELDFVANALGRVPSPSGR